MANQQGNSGKFHGAGYYRFQEPAGIIMPESTPGPVHCQAYGSGKVTGKEGTLDCKLDEYPKVYSHVIFCSKTFVEF